VAAPSSAVEIHSIFKRYGKVQAVSGVSFDVARRTGRNHLRILARAGGHPERRVGAVLDEGDLSVAADRRVGRYSTGMRRASTTL
jgi:ABC-type multidrug transport system ATPase subunit